MFVERNILGHVICQSFWALSYVVIGLDLEPGSLSLVGQFGCFCYFC